MLILLDATLALPATWLSIRLFDRMQGRSVVRKIRLITFLGWAGFTWAALTYTYEINLQWKLRLIDLTYFDTDSDPYGLRNLLVPRLVVWFACTIPSCVIALWIYSKTTKPTGFPIVPVEKHA